MRGMGRKAGGKPKKEKKNARKPNKEGAHSKSKSGNAHSGSHEEEEHAGGTGGSASKSLSAASNKSSLQEDVMTQVIFKSSKRDKLLCL